MRHYARTVAVAVSATLILAAAVSTASANHLSTSNPNIRVVWSPLEFNGEGLAIIRCNVTLEGNFVESTITKVVGTLIGRITRAGIIRPCTGGTAWIYNGEETNEVLGGRLGNTLPWHITYEGFEGTLPNITGVRILLEGARFLLRATILGVTMLCNYTTGATHGGNASGIAKLTNAHVVANLRADESRRIRSETGGCPTGRFVGEGQVTQLNSTNLITITLI